MLLGNHMQLLPQFFVPRLHAAAVVHAGSRHLEQRTRTTERKTLAQGEVDLPTTPACAYHFFALISFMTSISRSRSARSFLRRLFSRSSSFSRAASDASMPPYLLRQR